MVSFPIIIDDIDDIEVINGSDQTTIELSSHFDDPFTTGLTARFELYDNSLAGGVTEIVLFDQDTSGAPGTVTNFSNYVLDEDYVNTIIHRSMPGFVVQGGGFTVDGLADVLPNNAPDAVSLVPTDPPITNEFSSERSNVRGTIAMAKIGGDPDSATNEWFFNLGDNGINSGNPNNLDVQNGGFTVFGEVLSEEDFDVLEAIAALPIVDGRGFFEQGAFSDLPLIDFDQENPVITGDENLVRYQNISLVQREELTFEVVNNTNSILVDVSIDEGNLLLDYQPGLLGTAEVTIRATNLVGEVIEDIFIVTVEDAPPTTSGIDDIIVNEDEEPTIISLFDAFDDLEDNDSDLTYSIIDNTNADLFSSLEIDDNSGELTLTYQPNSNGIANITVQAQDLSGQTIDTTFSTTVNSVNDAPNFTLGDNQTVPS
ncbi:MAG TPA: hypothetical protein DCF68_20745, partial [Cyanothece sp. UBA12306]|nr:hypothetical protein [Cyanothece sp. UBA12306]